MERKGAKKIKYTKQEELEAIMGAQRKIKPGEKVDQAHISTATVDNEVIQLVPIRIYGPDK